MSYGIKLENDLGETITEYSDVLYEVGTGNTITPPTFPDNFGTFGDRAYFEMWTKPERLNSSPQTPWFQQVASSGRMLTGGLVPTGKQIRSWIGDDKFTLDDMAFVQPGPSGIWGAMSSPIYPPNGATPEMQFAVCSYPDYNLNYKIASTRLPPGLSGNYGMQIKKPNGDIAFDSRAKILPLVGHFYVSEADMKAVVEGGATRLYTIPTPAAGAYLSMPYWTSFKFTGNNSVYVPILRQTDVNEFMLLRGIVPEILPGRIPGSSYLYGASAYFHDATVMVAMDI